MYFETDETDPGPYRRLDLVWSNGYVPQELNLGFPDIRDVTQKKPSANGTYDYTRHFGAAAVQVKLALESTAMPVPLSDRKLEDQLRHWLNPQRRTNLVWRQRGEDDWRKTLIRASDGNRTINLARTQFGVLSMVFRAPKGYSESYEQFTKNLPFNGTEAGRTYDLTFDRVYPASGTIGVVDVENLGNTDSYPVLRLYGPATEFRVENITTGMQLKFKTTFALLTGQFIEINLEEGTVLMGADISNDRYNEIDVATSDWWVLAEGVNQIRAVAATYTAPEAHGEIFWRHTYI